MNTVSIVLPAYNEAACIGTLLDRIRDSLRGRDLTYEVVVVDDGSDDNTVEIVEQRAARMPIRILRHKGNSGYGAALHTGLLEAIPLSEVVVTMDADDSHDPALIPEMLEAIESGNDVVIASRMQPGGRVVGVPVHRRLLSEIASRVLRVRIPMQGVRDFTSGYRAYRTTLLKKLVEDQDRVPLVSEKGFVAGFELLCKAGRAGAAVAEVPLVLRYDRKMSASRMKILATTRDYVRLLTAPESGEHSLRAGGLRANGRRGSRRPDRASAVATGASDLISAMAAFAAAYALYGWALRAGWVDQPRPGVFNFMAMGAFFGLLSVLVLWRGGQYGGRASVLDLRLLQSTARYLFVVAAIYLAVLFLVERTLAPTVLIGLAIGLSVLVFLLGRRFTWSALRKWQLSHGRGRRILIYGSGDTGQLLMKKIMQAPRMGAVVVGFIDGLKPLGSNVRCNVNHRADDFFEVPVLGRIHDLEALVAEYAVDEMLVAVALERADLMPDLLTRCHALDIDIGFVPKIGDVRADQLRVEDISAITVLRPDSGSATKLYFVAKRLIDILLSALLIAATLPIWIVLAVLIRRNSAGPAIFRQLRVGERGKPFEILKFRTMYEDSDAFAESPITGSDPRLTSVGKHLRLAGLDELPQLLNVLRGEMSLVGPRPEMSFIAEGYGSLERQRLQAKPGISGLWQLSPDRGQQIHANLEYDLYYLRNRSLALDFLILGETIIFAAKNLFSVTRQRLTGLGTVSEVSRTESPAHGLTSVSQTQASVASGSYVLVALDQRRRPAESASWESLVPAFVALSQRWPVKLLVASCNGLRIDEIVNREADQDLNGGGRLPEYLEYTNTSVVQSAAVGATVVVTDLLHVASWARDSGTSLVRLERGSVYLENGHEPTSIEVLEVLRELVSVGNVESGLYH